MGRKELTSRSELLKSYLTQEMALFSPLGITWSPWNITSHMSMVFGMPETRGRAVPISLDKCITMM